MKINYNDWFYDYHKYLKGNRDGVDSFNDTKWIDMNKRYNSIMSIDTDLINNQPFGVISNDNGFDKLIDLMSRSNYTFEDINESLIDTYYMSLRNSMSRMIVNTQSVIFKCNNMDKKHVSSDKYSGYYIVDVTFDQLHFGDRDEFIRQKLHKMHTTENNYYVDMDDFITGEFTSILGFTILCTINGFICNDCKIAIDDKGFKFKIRWGYSSDVEFIIYKLDEAFIHKSDVDVLSIFNKKITYDELGLTNDLSYHEYKCLINIYDKNFKSTVPSVPNFGEFDNTGLVIKNIQNRTISDLQEYKSKKATVVIYVLKYLKEVPNIYPAVNYYDIMDSRLVLTDKGEYVKNYKSDRILSSDTNNVNNLEICTPPIALDRCVNVSFDIITSCLNLYDEMIQYENIFKNIGETLLSSNLTQSIVNQNIIRPINQLYDRLMNCYIAYVKGDILTSLVPDELINKFKKFVDSLNKIRNISDINEIQLNTIDEFYYDNYKLFVNNITKPFQNEKLNSFRYMSKLSNNYFHKDNHETFMRPVSEQCFISLRYHREEECWLFDYPNIKRFNGIGNVFYIDNDLNGDEIFKFFVLYTDTESVHETKVNDLKIEQIMDFDLFCQEVDKHVGYVRYWQMENKLMKISQIMCNDYNNDTVIQVLSKILKKKIDGDDMMNIYPSDINYEPSNITSDNIQNWNSDSDRAPFAVNFLFYTLSMLNGNEDKLQSYFFHKLTSKKFNNRYSDIEISSIINQQKKYPINFSKLSVLPDSIDLMSSDIKSDNNIFYGLPYMINHDGNNVITPYLYTFNICYSNFKFNSLKNTDEYVSYGDPFEFGYKSISHYNDIYICKLVTYYLNYIYDYISELQTNYTETYDQTFLLDSCIETIENHISIIAEFVNDNNIFTYNDTSSIVDLITHNNLFLISIYNIKSLISDINKCTHNKRVISNIRFFNDFMKILKGAYIEKGFDNYSLSLIRKLYGYLKMINTPMNPYQYKKWLNDIDVNIIKNLNSGLSNNDSYMLNESVFNSFYESFIKYRDKTIPLLNALITSIDNLSISLRDEHINILTHYCNDIINNHMIDLFIISDIKFDKNVKYSRKPYVVTFDIYSTDDHIRGGNDVSLIFFPIVDVIDDRYVITSISKMCEYAFFSGNSIDDCIINILDESGSLISEINASIGFINIGNLTDVSNDIYQIPNTNNTRIDIQNIHESLYVNELGEIISKKYTNMNYEMLIGNHFVPLEYKTQKVNEDISKLQGPIDRLYIPNQLMNDLINDDYKNHSKSKVYFKPSQIIHLPIDDAGGIRSIGDKYHVGQRLYLTPHDDSYIFPIIITAIDHSNNKGFIEAVVDRNKCEWFNITDREKISKYLMTDIDCCVIDDNICNFLNEFNNPSFVYYKMDHIINEFNCKEYNESLIYLGDSFINSDNNSISIKMINHNMNIFTNPEMYPVLREEPNDHEVWNKEKDVFKEHTNLSTLRLADLNHNIVSIMNEVRNAKTENDKQNALLRLETARTELDREKAFFDRIRSYTEQLESPTTWYNTRSYDDTLVYIENGRAKLSASQVNNIRDLPFTDKMKIVLYDWEHDSWINQDSYYIENNTIESVKIDELDNYNTYNIIHSITIKLRTDLVESKKILVYLSYEPNVPFNINMNDYNCKVRFKPILSLPVEKKIIDIYHGIKIRKHFDGFELYNFKEFNPPNDFSINESFYIKRYKRSGEYNYSPRLLISDIQLLNNDNVLDFNSFDIYIQNTFKDVSTDRTYKSHFYKTTIHHDIDNFIDNQIVKLICIQNNNISSYNGNISNIMFEGLLKYDESNSQTINIIDSTLPNNISGSFVCCVFRDDLYRSFGGVITVEVSIKEYNTFDSKNHWMRIPHELCLYREIPNEFILVPKIDITFSSDDVNIVLQSKYEKDIDDFIDENNCVMNNPKEYYYDKTNKTRLPISNVRGNKYNERLVIDKNNNPSIELIKSTYIGVCRYSASKINQDGFIDLTGYINNSLSRDRYEFWINGRQITDYSNVIILSPTTIQLRGLKSLRNFEVIELVDDFVIDNDIFPKGNIYIDLEGRVYDSYLKALKGNHDVINQNIRFMFNQSNHISIQDYSNGIISDEKNIDIEQDILDNIILDDSVVYDYNNMTSTPSINGVSIYHPMSHSLGIIDIQNDNITDIFNSIWCKEIITNPLFVNTHKENNVKYNTIDFSIDNLDDCFSILVKGYSSCYFTLYISKTSYSVIDDTENTLKIIPFIKSGTRVLIDKSYRNMWIHSTLNTKSKRIK